MKHFLRELIEMVVKWTAITIVVIPFALVFVALFPLSLVVTLFLIVVASE